MNRWMILILFVLTLVSGYLAFAFAPTNTLWLIDALFLASVIIFLMGFVQLVGRSLKSDMAQNHNARHNNPVHEHAHSQPRSQSRRTRNNDDSS
jgi:uncharacterized membrane protein YtjA (UPF0391 family)